MGSKPLSVKVFKCHHGDGGGRVRLKVCTWAGAWVHQSDNLGVSMGKDQLSPEEAMWTHTYSAWGAPQSGFQQHCVAAGRGAERGHPTWEQGRAVARLRRMPPMQPGVHSDHQM